ncbi:hypothetical protein AZE42_07177 [Rhizopogon vesiculosus]|uniref:Major facilitator superfamily (MFS) profile domain-containing protein n=1 Tax=Rhizopogon vesiculosus TaxID=180088 RepID=A0A1J8QG21_9AGAM|nr:hypothetical protein AZE42_07177 [Rhizopogon vesiculosus]
MLALPIRSPTQAAAHNFTGLIIARLGLGTFEAAFGGPVMLYLSFYYTKTEYAIRIAYWLGFAAIAGAFGGLFAYGIQHVKVSIANLRLLFMLEGTPTILLGCLCILMLPDRPESTPFLTEAKRKIAISRMNRGTCSGVGAVIYVVAYMSDDHYGGVVCAPECPPKHKQNRSAPHIVHNTDLATYQSLVCTGTDVALSDLLSVSDILSPGEDVRVSPLEMMAGQCLIFNAPASGSANRPRPSGKEFTWKDNPGDYCGVTFSVYHCAVVTKLSRRTHNDVQSYCRPPIFIVISFRFCFDTRHHCSCPCYRIELALFVHAIEVGSSWDLPQPEGKRSGKGRRGGKRRRIGKRRTDYEKSRGGIDDTSNIRCAVLPLELARGRSPSPFTRPFHPRIGVKALPWSGLSRWYFAIPTSVAIA